MNKKEILFNFIKEYKNSNSDKRDEAIEKAEKEISTLLKAERQSIIEIGDKMKKEPIPNPIQDFNLPHENTSEYNEAIKDYQTKIKSLK